MHENIDEFKKLGVDMYIVSGDQPEQQKELFTVIQERYEYSLPFLSDPKLELIGKMDMKNGDMSYRGYGLIDGEGKVVFKTVNDHWGEQYKKTLEEIKGELKEIEKN